MNTTMESAVTLNWRQGFRDRGMELYEFNDATTVRTMLRFGREWIRDDDAVVALLCGFPDDQAEWIADTKPTRDKLITVIEELEGWLECKGLVE
ncbi:hypothetical protein [Phyllobacterium myrsinacearum]|uniref:Uncharacterized protein n=1 Tax=Phyllobacterium myrsinacearum TaxID=28101 RepID=A0A839EYW1_9HYPH|nr:hypothetical protein [Phyllobacterium myrsinacearum]MBA8881660.1 hypothetical protein [Phyllobacterium myrsinacearum]